MFQLEYLLLENVAHALLPTLHSHILPLIDSFTGFNASQDCLWTQHSLLLASEGYIFIQLRLNSIALGQEVEILFLVLVLHIFAGSCVGFFAYDYSLLSEVKVRFSDLQV